ncbi:hypothetical protein [Escherichia coli]|uniref:hypothetical protein n=1 Tax=Escherichia coli TaxID=562 RepID=UPI0039760A40
MKHVLNIALMAVVILGLAMLEATNWGYAVLAIPAVIWAKSVLNLLHKLPVLAAAFWILVAVFAWQAALVVTNGAIVIHTQRLKSDPGGNLLS